MKKHFLFFQLTFFILLLSSSIIAYSTGNSLSISDNAQITSSADESEIYNAFSEINDLVSYVTANNNVTYAGLQAENSSLISLINDNSALALFPEDIGFSFNNQTAFFMGCVFGVLGILAVAIINNGNTSIVNSSIWGCVSSGFISAGVVIAFYVFYFAAFTGFYY